MHVSVNERGFNADYIAFIFDMTVFDVSYFQISSPRIACSRVQVTLPQEDLFSFFVFFFASRCAEKPLLARDCVIQKHVVDVSCFFFLFKIFIFNKEVRTWVRRSILLEAHDSRLPILSIGTFRA